jgi:hypothetical protein
MKKKPATINPAYREFVRAKNNALELILDAHLIDLSKVLGRFLGQAEDAISTAALKCQGHFFDAIGVRAEQEFTAKLKNAQRDIIPALAQTIINLSRKSYLLSYASEMEALAQAMGKRIKYGRPGSQTAHLGSQDEPIHARAELALWRVEEKIIGAFKLARIQELPTLEFIDKVKSVFPRKAKLPNRNTALLQPKLKESAGDSQTVKGVSYSTGLITNEEWSGILDSYERGLEMYQYRKPEVAGEKIYLPSEDGEAYLWELEQEATQNFVYEVRAGSKDSAEFAGIKDFVWVAIMDDKTDECCAWRDGLTVTEIEHRLSTDKKDDDCQASTVPAHFNCRCDMVPLSENVNEVSPPGGERFDEWLRS